MWNLWISNETLQLSFQVLADVYAYIFSHMLPNRTYSSMCTWLYNMIKNNTLLKDVVPQIQIILDS